MNEELRIRTAVRELAIGRYGARGVAPTMQPGDWTSDHEPWDITDPAAGIRGAVDVMDAVRGELSRFAALAREAGATPDEIADALRGEELP